MPKEGKEDKKVEYYLEDISHIKGELHLIIEQNLRISYAFQRTAFRIYLDIKDGGTLRIPRVIDVLERALEWIEKREGCQVLLCGPAVTQIQLRSDLREYYTGLPDNYDIGMFMGNHLSEAPIKIPLGKNSQGKEVEKNCVSFAETSKRKQASVMSLDTSTGKFRPKTGREADILDCYLLLLTGASIDSRLGEYTSQFKDCFKEAIRESFPEHYEAMVKSSLL